jgi:hypothetical protein
VLSVACDRFVDPAGKLEAMATANDLPNATAITPRGTEGLVNPRGAPHGANLLFAGLTSSSAAGSLGWNAYVRARSPLCSDCVCAAAGVV